MVISIALDYGCPRCRAGFEFQAPAGKVREAKGFIWNAVVCEGCGLAYVQVWRSIAPEAWRRWHRTAVAMVRSPRGRGSA